MKVVGCLRKPFYPFTEETSAFLAAYEVEVEALDGVLSVDLFVLSSEFY